MEKGSCKKQDLIDTITLIDIFLEGLDSSKKELNIITLDKKTYDSFLLIKKDLKYKYNQDIYISKLTERLSSIFWLKKYRFNIIFYSIYCIVFYLFIFLMVINNVERFYAFFISLFIFGFLIIQYRMFEFYFEKKMENIFDNILAIKRELERYRKT